MENNFARKEFNENEADNEVDFVKLQEIEDLKRRLDLAARRQITEKERLDNIFYHQGRTLQEQQNNLKLNQVILTILFVFIALLAAYSCVQWFI